MIKWRSRLDGPSGKILLLCLMVFWYHSFHLAKNGVTFRDLEKERSLFHSAVMRAVNARISGADSRAAACHSNKGNDSLFSTALILGLRTGLSEHIQTGSMNTKKNSHK